MTIRAILSRTGQFALVFIVAFMLGGQWKYERLLDDYDLMPHDRTKPIETNIDRVPVPSQRPPELDTSLSSRKESNGA
jgi:hypothetical protein